MLSAGMLVTGEAPLELGAWSCLTVGGNFSVLRVPLGFLEEFLGAGERTAACAVVLVSQGGGRGPHLLFLLRETDGGQNVLFFFLPKHGC